MKTERQEVMLRLVRSGSFKTQEELADALTAAGFVVGQATVSRDIRELGLVKTTGPGGEKYFVPPRGADSRSAEGRLRRKLGECGLSREASGNMVVIRTPPGEAPALSQALDEAAWPEMLGALAGHDLVLVVAREGQVRALMEKLGRGGG